MKNEKKNYVFGSHKNHLFIKQIIGNFVL